MGLLYTLTGFLYTLTRLLSTLMGLLYTLMGFLYTITPVAFLARACYIPYHTRTRARTNRYIIIEINLFIK